MRYEHEVLFILDSILDDYYLLWECFEEYKQIIASEGNLQNRFSEALKEAYENKFVNFFIGENFNGEEEVIPNFELTNSVIEKLLDFEYTTAKEIRITTSNVGIEFLKKHQSH
jgi:hypothetical protein